MRLREALSAVGYLLGALLFAAVLAWTAMGTYAMSFMIAPTTLLLGLPMLGLYCLRYLVVRRPGPAEALTNIPLFLSSWAIGAALGATLLPFRTAAAPLGLSVDRLLHCALLAMHALFLAWLWGRREMFKLESQGLDARWAPLFNAILLLGLGSTLFSLLVTGAAGTTFIAAQAALLPGGRHSQLAALYLAAAACPPFFAGVGLLRRGVWMLEVRRHTANLATSTVRGAAAGLVELSGSAAGAPADLTGRFTLDDGTGTVTVETPAGLSTGQDDRLRLERGGGGRLTVIGEFVPPATLRPWTPPFGRFLDSVVDRFVDETLQRDADDNWRQFGFACPRDIFLVTDLDERRAKAVLLSAWRRVLAAGVYLLACAGVLLALAARS